MAPAFVGVAREPRGLVHQQTSANISKVIVGCVVLLFGGAIAQTTAQHLQWQRNDLCAMDFKAILSVPFLTFNHRQHHFEFLVCFKRMRNVCRQNNTLTCLQIVRSSSNCNFSFAVQQ
jgi:hypothetical protein